MSSAPDARPLRCARTGASSGRPVHDMREQHFHMEAGSWRGGRPETRQAVRGSAPRHQRPNIRLQRTKQRWHPRGPCGLTPRFSGEAVPASRREG